MGILNSARTLFSLGYKFPEALLLTCDSVY
jgi:hypothetical protein